MELAVIGDNIVDCYFVDQTAYPGGNCANVAAHAARMGAAVSYIGAVGDDPAGAAVRAALVDEGVDTDRLRTLPGGTGYTEIHLAEGERHFGDFDRGVAVIAPNEGDLTRIGEHRIVHTSYASQLESHLRQFADRATVSFDFDSHIADTYAQGVIGAVGHAFFSASHLTESEAVQAADWALAEGVTSVTVTLGARGAIFRAEGQTHFSPAAPTELVDTLGAGDAFIARVLVGILNGETPEHFMEQASRTSATVCAQVGAFGHGFPLSSVHQLSTSPVCKGAS